jgi:hypothetical protein
VTSTAPPPTDQADPLPPGQARHRAGPDGSGTGRPDLWQRVRSVLRPGVRSGLAAFRLTATTGRRLRTVGSRLVAWSGTVGALDSTVCLLFGSVAFWLTGGLWPNPATRALADNVNDQALIEWFLAHGVLAWRGDFSLVTDRLNAPDGVNLMSNASHILHGVLMAPVTALFGVPVSFAVLVGLNLAATAAGWYLLLARGLGLHRVAAFVGGLFTGFAPGMISQSNSHLHITAQWLVSPMVWCVIRLTRVTTDRAAMRTGAALGGLVAAQLLLGEEVLFLTVLTVGLFAVVYALCRRAWAARVAGRVVRGLAVAGGVALVGTAYPVWIQFHGRQHTPNAPFAPKFFYADLASFHLISPLSLAGSPAAGRLATSATEYNTYLGLPLLIVVAACVLWRWRSPVVIATTVTGLFMFALSLGPTVIANGHPTHLPTLYSLLADVPVVNGALPTRYALALIPLIAVLLADTLHHALTGEHQVVAVAAGSAVLVALVPITPRQLATVARAPVPAFIASGDWRQCVPDGGVLVPVPLPTPQRPDAMRWPAAANAAFAIPEGFFIGPYGPGGRSSIGVYPRPTSQLLAEVARTGAVPTIDQTTKERARADLAYWKADCVALAPTPSFRPLRTTLEQLLGPGRLIRDTWTWQVH